MKRIVLLPNNDLPGEREERDAIPGDTALPNMRCDLPPHFYR
jgi:hypothetical protein